MTWYVLLALWSIHERLAGKVGADLPAPDSSWLDDLEAWEWMRLAAEDELADAAERARLERELAGM